jgi:hypothetical protein
MRFKDSEFCKSRRCRKQAKSSLYKSTFEVFNTKDKNGQKIDESLGSENLLFKPVCNKIENKRKIVQEVLLFPVSQNQFIV